MIGTLLEPAKLRGERLLLRPYADGFSEEELRRIYAWSLDHELILLCGAQPLSVDFGRFCSLFREQLRRKGAGRDGELLYAILDEGGQLIGRVGLFGLGRLADERGGSRRPTSGSTQAELGIMIGERTAWGRGYGREAVRLMIDHGFGPLGLGAIVLYTYPDNLRAQRAFTAAGFREVRIVRRFSLSRGAHDELEMAIDASQAGRDPLRWSDHRPATAPPATAR